MIRHRIFVVTLILLGGCTVRDVRMRALPDETPAADNAAAVKKAEQVVQAVVTGKQTSTPPVEPQDAPSMRTYDPWERLNRFTYRFNARFDEAIFLPVADKYGRLPAFLRGGVHDFFGNLSEVDSVINFALQGRPIYAARGVGRFLINSTIGIAGLFDVAAQLHLPPEPTGFGTTLAKWGMHPAPYLVVPFLGPSTLRDGVGMLGDFAVSYAVDMGGLYRTSKNAWMLGVVDGIDQRSSVDFRYYSTGSAFEYETIRFLFVRKRLIEDEGLHADEPKLKPTPGAPAGQ